MKRFLIFAPGPSLDLYQGQDISLFTTIGMGGTCFYHTSQHHLYLDPNDDTAVKLRETQSEQPDRIIYQAETYRDSQHALFSEVLFFNGKAADGKLGTTLDLPPFGYSLCFAVRLAIGIGGSEPTEINILGCVYCPPIRRAQRLGSKLGLDRLAGR